MSEILRTATYRKPRVVRTVTLDAQPSDGWTGYLVKVAKGTGHTCWAASAKTLAEAEAEFGKAVKWVEAQGLTLDGASAQADYVTGSKSTLSNPMVSLLEYLAAKENGVRYLKGVNLTHQYTWFKENRITARTWKALEDRGLIVDDATTTLSVVSAEGYRALFQLAIPDDLHQAIVDAAHADAVTEDLERRNAELGEILDAAEEAAEREVAEAMERDAAEHRESVAAEYRDRGLNAEDADMLADWNVADETGSYAPESATYEPCGCLRNSAGAHRGGCPGAKDWADAADALLDERMTEEIPAWGTEPEHAVQAVWYHRNLTGLDAARDSLTQVRRHTVSEDAVDQAVALGWLQEERRELPDSNPYGLDVLRSYRVADRVRNLAMLRAAMRHRSYPVAPLDSRVLAQPADQGGGVTRLTIGTDTLGGWYLVREGVSPVTFELDQRSLLEHRSKEDAQYDLTSRTSSLLGWGWSQASRFTGDGVTEVR